MTDDINRAVIAACLGFAILPDNVKAQVLIHLASIQQIAAAPAGMLALDLWAISEAHRRLP